MRSSPKVSSYKVVFLGESSVGKSSILRQLCLNKFDPKSESTIGAAYRRHSIVINESDGIEVSNTYISLDLWDTAGQERFNSLIPMYLKNTAAIMIVYDVTNDYTFDKLIDRWLPFIRNTYYECPLIYCFANKIDLIGNNIDKNDKVHNQLLKIEKLFPNNNCRIFKTSAKTNIGINDAFNLLAIELYQNNDEKDINFDELIIDDNIVDNFDNNYGCCT